MKKMLLLSFVLFACEGEGTLTYNNILYTVSCTDCAVTYKNEDGGIAQVSNANSDWEHRLYAQEGDHLYLSAQNNKDTGIIQVRITRNGKVMKEATSEGAYVIATVSATIK